MKNSIHLLIILLIFQISCSRQITQLDCHFDIKNLLEKETLTINEFYRLRALCCFLEANKARYINKCTKDEMISKLGSKYRILDIYPKKLICYLTLQSDDEAIEGIHVIFDPKTNLIKDIYYTDL